METEEFVEGEWVPDPNEPRYCLCNQVSYGDMVACDNPEVSRSIAFIARHAFNCYLSAVPVRMVPLRLCGHHCAAQGQVVLPALFGVDEEERSKAVNVVQLVDVSGESAVLCRVETRAFCY